jgi:RHS repeat-associated protein
MAALFDANARSEDRGVAMPTTLYHWDEVSDCVLQESDGAGNVQVTYTNERSAYGPLLSERRGTVDSQYHFDALGSTRALTDNSQTVTDTFTYDAWGNEVARTLAVLPSTSFTWMGRMGYISSETASANETYVRARSYRTSQGQWLSVDPLRRELSRYRYGVNAPVIVVDPSGQISCNSCPTVREDIDGEGVCTFFVSTFGKWRFRDVQAIGVWQTLGGPPGSQIAIVSRLLCQYERVARPCHKCDPCCFVIAPADRLSRSRDEMQYAGIVINMPPQSFMIGVQHQLQLGNVLPGIWEVLLELVGANLTLIDAIQLTGTDLTLAQNKCQGQLPTSTPRPVNPFIGSYNCERRVLFESGRTCAGP